MNRIETLMCEEKNMIYFDLSNIRNNDELISIIESAKEMMSQYANNSLYTITNISNISFDTKTKELAAEWMKFNTPFVIYCVLIGVDGIKKIMFKSIFKLSERSNVKMLPTKDRAVHWIIQRH